MGVLIDFISLIVIGGIVALTDENKKLFAIKSSVILAIVLMIAVSGIFGAFTLNNYYVYPIAVLVAVIAIIFGFIAKPRLNETVSTLILIAIYYLLSKASIDVLTIIFVQAFAIILLLSGIENQVALGAIAILSANAFTEPNAFNIGYLLPIMACVIVFNAVYQMLYNYNLAKNHLKIGTKSFMALNKLRFVNQMITKL